MRRRHFLRAAAAGTLAALAPTRPASAQMPGMPGMPGRPRAWRSAWPTGLPLRDWPLLAQASPDADDYIGALTAAPYAASLVSGGATELWGYNQSFPGPMIEVVEGQRVTIDFTNRLALDSTIHWHGLPVPPDQDGSPLDPVAPGASRTYSFDVRPGTAGTYWYHPHAHRTTTLQVAHGLAAPFIVRSAEDPLDALPELTLMITSLALDARGQVIASAAPMGGMAGPMTAGAGVLLVNGQRRPVHTTTPGATERWRIINATADRYLRLDIEGHGFAVVGTDGGLLGAPLVAQTEWLLAPAQRVEIVVGITDTQHARFALRDLGYGARMDSGGSATLMSIATSEDAAQAPIPLPATLRPVTDLGAPSAAQRIVLSGAGMGTMGSFLINGRTFDMNRVDVRSVVGRVESWDIVNATPVDHPIHIHGTQFQVAGRTVGGVATPAPYRAWLDTVNVPAGETVTIETVQSLPGKRMFHCHILPHEDAGMMGVLDVSPA